MILADASSKEYHERGRFTIPDPVGGIGATYPIIAGGRLFVRDDNKLLCYDISEDALKLPSSRPQTIELPLPAGALGSDVREHTLRLRDHVEKFVDID